jgi:hypothetical protein
LRKLHDLFAARLLAGAGPQLMDRSRHAGTAAERVFQVNRAAVLLEEIAERLIRKFLKVLHLVVAEKVELPPGRFVELHTLARHRSPFQLLRGGAAFCSFHILTAGVYWSTIPKSLPSDLIEGWMPVFGKDHAQTKSCRVIDGMVRLDLS